MLFVRFPWLGQRPLSHSYMMYENPLWISGSYTRCSGVWPSGFPFFHLDNNNNGNKDDNNNNTKNKNVRQSPGFFPGEFWYF